MTEPLQHEELEALEKVARTADLASPWRHEKYHRVWDANSDPVCKPYGKTFGAQDAFGEHIATFDPSTVLRLIDQLKAKSGESEPRRSALERVTANFKLAVEGKPVRDMAETLAEVEAALSAPTPKTPTREEIARLIDPRQWQEREWLLERVEHWRTEIGLSGDNETRRKLVTGNTAQADGAVALSLAKADSILSLIQKEVSLG